MRVIEGLKEYQAIKFNEGYIVELGLQDHIVNRIRTNLKQIYIKQEELYLIKRIVNIPPTITHYLDSNNEIKSVEFFKQIDSEFFNSDTGEYEYPDLETEYKCKKQKELLRPIYSEQIETQQPVQIEVIGEQLNTGSDFIITPYSLGKSSFDLNNGIFKIPCKNAIAIDEFLKLKKEYKLDDFNLGINQNLDIIKYARVNNQLIFSNPNLKEEDLINKKSKVFSTLIEAKNYEAKIRKFTRDSIFIHLKQYQKIEDIERSQLLKDLSYLHQKINELEVKVKSASVKNQCLKIIQELKDKLVEVINSSIK